MKYIFVGGLYPKERIEEIRNQGDNSMGIAANVLQWSLVDGLDSFYSNLKIVTTPYISTYSKNNYTLYFEKSIFSHNNGSSDFCVGFLNLPLIRQVSRFYNLKRTLNKVIKKGDKCTFFIYGVHSPFLKAVLSLHKHSEIKTCLIVTDLPQYMSESKNIIKKFFKKIDSYIIRNCIRKIDSFVLLTKYMYDPLKINSRPWTLIEGIYNTNDEVECVQEKDGLKRILYTGGLYKRNGIIDLVHAFMEIDNNNYRLIICGEGSDKAEIIFSAEKDDRIIYKGSINREEVLDLQRKCDLLINPRKAEGEYTKYSFPSKTMEYLASGTPTLLYELPGIPEEYYDYCYSLSNDRSVSLSQKIIEVLNKPEEELKIFGLKAREFILKNKNPEKQCEKISKMINNL